jgi:hypothetical protein
LKIIAWVRPCPIRAGSITYKPAIASTIALSAASSIQNNTSSRTWRALATGAGASSKSIRLETSIVGRERERR